jgi:hypothetical protein
MPQDARAQIEVVALVAPPEQEQRLQGAEPEAEVGREGDRHVDVEDPLRDALVGVFRRDDERKDERKTHGEGSEPGESREAA